MTATTHDEGRSDTPDALTGGIHHIAVQTADFRGCVAWYREYLGCTLTWQRDSGYSAVSLSRLPHLGSVAELAVADLRFHIFDRPEVSFGQADTAQFQHVAIRVSSSEQVRRWRARWFELFHSGRHTFARPEPASEVDIDAEGTHSFYAFDVNGLEFEFTYLPGGTDEAP